MPVPAYIFPHPPHFAQAQLKLRIVLAVGPYPAGEALNCLLLQVRQGVPAGCVHAAGWGLGGCQRPASEIQGELPNAFCQIAASSVLIFEPSGQQLHWLLKCVTHIMNSCQSLYHLYLTGAPPGLCISFKFSEKPTGDGTFQAYCGAGRPPQ